MTLTGATEIHARPPSLFNSKEAFNFLFSLSFARAPRNEFRFANQELPSDLPAPFVGRIVSPIVGLVSKFLIWDRHKKCRGTAAGSRGSRLCHDLELNDINLPV